MIKTAEDVIREMKMDASAYSDFMEKMALRYLESDAELLQSWINWLNGKDYPRPEEFST